MGIISRPRSNPAMIRAIARYCSYRDYVEIREADLRAIIVPSGVAGTGDGSVWADTLGLLEEFGLVARDGESVRVAPTLVTDLAGQDPVQFRSALRAVVLDEEHNTNLWALRGGQWSSDGSREFTRIAAWYLDIPIDEAYGQVAYAQSRKDLDQARKLIENEEQWRVFVRWSDALGLTSSLFGKDLPDPAVAVSDELPAVFDGEDELPARDFQRRLLQRIPVLHGGIYAQGLTEHRSHPVRHPPGGAGPALSAALRRLSGAGAIEFVARSDADHLVVDDLDGPTPTHIRLVGA